MNISRGDSISPFYAMEVKKEANKLQAAGHEIFHMELGEPGGPPPLSVLRSAQNALGSSDPNIFGYTEALGSPSLRKRIAQYYSNTDSNEIESDRVIVTTGSSSAFTLGLLAAFQSGARIGLTEPGYPAYRNIVQALGMTVVPIATEPGQRYQPTTELLDTVGKLDGLVIASPANPTGTMLDKSLLASLVNWSQDRGVRLISDEVYHGITYEADAVSLAKLDRQAIVINSFSKYFCMPGWRLGWMIVPPELIRPVELLAQNLFISPPALAQHAALEVFGCIKELDDRVATYAKNRLILLDSLPLAGFDKLAPPDGAFYIFADVQSLTDDSASFCKQMLHETGVAVTPGTDFDSKRGKRFLRFSIAGPTKTIEKAAKRLISWRS